MIGSQIETPYGPGKVERLIPAGYWVIRLETPAEIMKGHLSGICMMGPTELHLALGLENSPENLPEEKIPTAGAENQLRML